MTYVSTRRLSVKSRWIDVLSKDEGNQIFLSIAFDRPSGIKVC
jgi:hypothetical protein